MSRNSRTRALGIIGGSGVYDIDGLAGKRWKKVSSPFGDPSDELLCGELNGQPMVFLPRHGRGHRLFKEPFGIQQPIPAAQNQQRGNDDHAPSYFKQSGHNDFFDSPQGNRGTKFAPMPK